MCLLPRYPPLNHLSHPFFSPLGSTTSVARPAFAPIPPATMRQRLPPTPNLCPFKNKSMPFGATLKKHRLRCCWHGKGNMQVMLAKQSQFFLKLKKPKHFYPP